MSPVSEITPSGAVKETLGAGAVPSAMTLICDVGPVASQAVFDTQTILGGPIPQIYKHLKLCFRSRTDQAGANLIRMIVNNDSGANYAASYGADSGYSSGLTSWCRDAGGYNWCVSGAPPGASAFLDFTFWDYAQTTFKKGWNGPVAFVYANANCSGFVASGSWNNVAAIQRLALSLSAGNFTEAHFSLYGI